MLRVPGRGLGTKSLVANSGVSISLSDRCDGTPGWLIDSARYCTTTGRTRYLLHVRMSGFWWDGRVNHVQAGSSGVTAKMGPCLHGQRPRSGACGCSQAWPQTMLSLAKVRPWQKPGHG